MPSSVYKVVKVETGEAWADRIGWVPYEKGQVYVDYDPTWIKSMAPTRALGGTAVSIRDVGWHIPLFEGEDEHGK